MDPAAPLPASIIRLAEQLQRLSEVAEGLTYRLLDLEERLSATEATLEQAVGSGQSSGQAEAIDQAERRLTDTEERLDRLEILLRQGALPRSLAVVQQDVAMLTTLPDDAEFIEEGEQPFMDELIA